MSYKAIYTYAWDLAETGVEAAASEFRGLGLDTVTIAASYHAGKFLRPHGKASKVYFPEDGTVYFNADASRYGAIKPAANSLLAERDSLGQRRLHARGQQRVGVRSVHGQRDQLDLRQRPRRRPGTRPRPAMNARPRAA